VRVAIIGSRGYPSTYGGFETLVRRLAPHLVNRGHDVVVYSREQSAPAGDTVRVLRTPGWESKSLSTLTFGGTASIHTAVSQSSDVALVLNVANGFFLPVLRARGISTVVNVDGLEWLRDKWSGAGKVAFLAGARMTARFGDILVYDSVAIEEHWRETFGRGGRFIPYGADVPGAVGRDRLAPLGLQPDGYLLVVARLVPENNIELALVAHESSGVDLPLVIVGSTTYEDPLLQRVADAARGPKVVWLGHVADQELLSQLWAHCAVYLHGHSVGGTNPGLLQALAHGAPTQALDTVFNREVLLHESFLFEPDAAALAGRLQTLAQGPDVRAALRRRGLARVQAAYAWADVLDAYEGVLLAAVAAGAGGRARGR